MREELNKLPQEFLAKLRNIYPFYYQGILNTFLRKKEPAFRINYIKTDLVTLRKELARSGISSRELSYPKGAFLLKSPLKLLQRTDMYQKGWIFVQNLSSMLPVTALEPKDSEKILDLCASPGAKTTQIASLAKGCELTAIEKIRTRYYKLLANLKIQGADNVRVHLIDGIWVRKKFPEYFDKILLDAPCSAEGRFYIQNPRSFSYWKERKVKEMAHKQKRLINAAIFALKEQGVLVYSTCTFSPEENESVIDWILNKFKESIEILPLKFPFSNAKEGLCRWRDKKFSSSLRLAQRIIPTNSMEGFFIAKLRKIKG